MSEAIVLPRKAEDPLWWRRKSRNLYFFEYNLLAKAWPDKFQDFGPFQQKMCEFLSPRFNSSKKKLLCAYRHSLKTTVLLGYVCWLFAWYHVKGEPTSINYNTAIEDNAVRFNDDVRETLMNSSLLQAAFDLPTTQKSYDAWTKKGVRLGHVKFMVSSFEEQQASRHAKIIINDDLVNEKNYFTEYSREEVKRKWRFQKSVASSMKGMTMNLEIDSGTPYHHDDLMWWLMTKNESYSKFIAAAIEGWPNVNISDVLNRTRNLTDPALMTYEILEDKIRDQERSVFSSQSLLKPTAEEDAFCLDTWLRYWTRLPLTTWRTFVIDAGGAIPGFHDASGFTIVDTDPSGAMYVVYADEFWLTPRGLLEKIVELKKRFNPDDTRIEKEKYAATVADEILHKLPQFDISFVEHKHRNKEDRIWRLRKLFEKGRIYIHENQTALKNQILEYQPPQDKKDDILDSLAYHLDIIRVPKDVERPRFEPAIEPTFDKEFSEYLAAVRARENPEEYDRVF